MTTVQIVGSFAFYAFSVLTPFVTAEFNLTRSAVGFIIVAMYVGFLLSLVPGGVFTDQRGERLVLGIALALIAIGSALVSIGPFYWVLMLGMLALGMGYGPIPSGTNKGIFDWFPVDTRTTGLSIKQTGAMVGSALAGVVLPLLATRTNWRYAMLFVAGVLTAGFVVVVLYSQSDESETTEEPDGLIVVVRERLAVSDFVRDSQFRPLLVSGFFFGASQFTVTGYVLLFLTEELLIVPVVAGLLYTATQLSGAGSRIVFGFVTDAWFGERKHLLLGGIGMIAAVAYLPLVVLKPPVTLPAVAAVLVAVGSLALGYNGVYLTIAGELTGPEDTGRATAVSITTISLGGVVTPPVFGYLVDVTSDYSLSFALLAVLCLLGGLAALRIGGYQPAEP